MGANTGYKLGYYGNELTKPCQCCGREIVKNDMTVHHIIPQHHMAALKGVPNDIRPKQQLAFLCRSCHDKVENFYKSKKRTELMWELKMNANDMATPAYYAIYAYTMNIYGVLYSRFLQGQLQKRLNKI